MVKRRFFVWFVFGWLILASLACGSVGIYDPQATQVSVQGTVSALQATLTAMETSVAVQAQQTPPLPEIIVITATPGFTPVATATQPLPTNTPAPASMQAPSQTSSSEREVIVIVATPTPTRTPETYAEAPIGTEPREGGAVEEGREILLRWSWNGILGPDEYYDIKIRPDGQSRSAYVAWEKADAHNWPANLSPGRYFWSVQVIRGYYKNNSGEPEDRVLQGYVSPESEPRLIIVDKKPKPKTSTPTKTPVPTDTPVPSP